MAPTDSTEVSNIITSLNLDKSDGPNSIPIKILKLLNKDTISPTGNSFQSIFFLGNISFNFEKQ